MCSEIITALWSTGLTVISGVLVYFLCECIKDFYLEPRKQYKDLVLKIEYSLIMYAQEIKSPLDISNKDEYTLRYDACRSVSTALRDLSAELVSKSSKLRCSKKSSKKKRKTAAEELMGLSNNITSNGNIDIRREENEKRVKTIRSCLDIDVERENDGTKNISKKRNKRS